MLARLSRGPLAVLLVVVSAACLSSCTSGPSSSASADSTTAPTGTTVAEPDSARAPVTPPPSERAGSARSVAQKLADATIATRVERALIQTSALRVFSFRTTVVDGHLMLRGDVNSLDQYRQAQRVAQRVDGVEALTNNLTVGGQSVTEERLASNEASPEEGESTAVYHTVRQGDTLWDIAREYRASVQQIRSLNDFSSSSLRPGQRIRVR